MQKFINLNAWALVIYNVATNSIKRAAQRTYFIYAEFMSEITKSLLFSDDAIWLNNFKHKLEWKRNSKNHDALLLKCKR